MPSSIAPYIKAQLKAGYTRDAIRRVLYQQGYTPYQVSEAEKDLHSSALKYWLVAAGIVGILSLLFLLWPESTPKFETPIITKTIPLEVEPELSCDDREGFERAFCIAEEAASLESCLTLEDQSLRDECINTYTLRTADFSGCKEIQEEALRESCFALKKSLGG